MNLLSALFFAVTVKELVAFSPTVSSSTHLPQIVVISYSNNEQVSPNTQLHTTLLRTPSKIHLSSSSFSNNDLNENDDSLIKDYPVKSSLPIAENFVNTFKDLKSNLTEGELGERGEIYVALQFTLILCILLGNVPLVGRFLTILLGPVSFAGGMAVIGLSAKELFDQGALSPWPVPTEDGQLVTDDALSVFYSEVRHPIYAGLLCTMSGWSFIHGSALSLGLTVVLYYVLNLKAEFEEEEMIQKYGIEYESYRDRVKEKFVPERLMALLPWSNTMVDKSESEEYF